MYHLYYLVLTSKLYQTSKNEKKCFIFWFYNLHLPKELVIDKIPVFIIMFVFECLTLLLQMVI